MAKLDRPDRGDIRAASAPDYGPRRQFHRQLKAIGRFSHEDDMLPLATKIMDRVIANRSRHSAGSYVLGDTDRNVYVLSDGNAMTAPLINASMPWYVGSYAMRSVMHGVRMDFPTAADILDDLVEHFRTLQPLNVTIEVES